MMDDLESPDSPLGESPNPLLIHTVIKEVMDYLTPPDLKICRLVCKQWDEELSKLLRKVFHLPLLTNRRLEEFLQANIMNHTFCSNYQLGPDITMNLKEEGSLVQRFFEIYGPFIKSLYLDHCKWSREDLLTILYNSCPNLEELLLCGSGVEEGLIPSPNPVVQEQKEEGTGEGSLAVDPQPSSSSNKSNNQKDNQILPLLKNIKCLRVNLICTRMIRNTKLMGDLLKISPNVETISWIETYLDEVRYDRNFQLDLERAWCAKPTENGITIRDTICDTAIHHKELQLSRLSRIESNMRINNESIQVLEKRQFPLKFLDISLTIDVTPNVLSSLLTSLSRSLVTLRLEFYPTHGTTNFFSFDFPKMFKLQHLFVQKFSASFSFYKNFNSTRFPSLRSLTFCETDFKGMIENGDVSQGCSNRDRNNLEFPIRLKNESIRILQVTCDLSRYSLSNEGILELSNFFPNLREARMENFDRMDKSIWEANFPKLKFFGSPSEKGLGGLPSPRGENECSKCCKHFAKGLYPHHQQR